MNIGAPTADTVRIPYEADTSGSVRGRMLPLHDCERAQAGIVEHLADRAVERLAEVLTGADDPAWSESLAEGILQEIFSYVEAAGADEAKSASPNARDGIRTARRILFADSPDGGRRSC